MRIQHTPPSSSVAERTRRTRGDRLSNALANLFFLCALLPFLSPVPAPSDVQLPAFVVAALIVTRDLVKGRFALNWIEGFFLAVGIWSFCFVLPGNPFNGRERIGLLAAFLVYYVVKKYAPRFSTKPLLAAIVVTFGSAIVQMGRPAWYQAVAPFFIRTVKDLSEGGRGASGPSAEPSFLAGMALVHGLLLMYYYAAGRLERRPFQIGLALSMASLLLSKSATGFMYLAVLAMIGAVYYAFHGMSVGRWTALAVSAAAIVVVVIGPLAESRGGALLVGLYEKPEDVLTDGSAQERVRCLTIGVLSLWSYPLGASGGGYPAVAVEMDTQYHLQRVFQKARRDTLTGVLNASGMYLVEIGLVYMFFIGVLLCGSLRIEVFHFLFCALSLLFLSFSFSITMPMVWLLLGIAARKDMFSFRRVPMAHAA